MRTILKTCCALAALSAFAVATAANATTTTFGTYDLTFSQFGSSPFGSVTVTAFGATGAHVDVTVGQNLLLNE